MIVEEITLAVPELAIVDAIDITPDDMPPVLTKLDQVFGSFDTITGTLTTGSEMKQLWFTILQKY